MAANLFFKTEEWETYRPPSERPLVVHIPWSEEWIRGALQHLPGGVDVAFVSQDTREIHAFVRDLSEELFDAADALTRQMSAKLGFVPQLRLIAHQGRPIPTEQADMSRII